MERFRQRLATNGCAPHTCATWLLACEERFSGEHGRGLLASADDSRVSGLVAQIPRGGFDALFCAPESAPRSLAGELAVTLGAELRVDESFAEAHLTDCAFAISRVAREFRGRRVALIALSSVVQALLGKALGGATDAGSRMHAADLAIAQLEVWGDGSGTLHRLGGGIVELEDGQPFGSVGGATCRIALIPHAHVSLGPMPIGDAGVRYRSAGLSQTGHIAAYRLARLTMPLRFEAVYSAPAARYVETARALSRAQGVEVVVEPGLGEGVEPASRGLRTTIDAVSVRAAMTRISRVHLGGDVAVVAHPWVVRLLLCHAARLDPRASCRIETTPASLNLVELDEQGDGLVLLVNQATDRVARPAHESRDRASSSRALDSAAGTRYFGLTKDPAQNRIGVKV